MAAAPIRRSTIHSIRLVTACRAARYYLLKNGGLSLGQLLDCLRNAPNPPIDSEAELSCRLPVTERFRWCAAELVQLDAAVHNQNVFMGATKQQMHALYEPTLNYLEIAYGPLECEVPDHLGGRELWGYDGSTRRPRSINPLKSRRHALRAGHPDQHYWSKKRVPYTYWRRSHPIFSRRK